MQGATKQQSYLSPSFSGSFQLSYHVLHVLLHLNLSFKSAYLRKRRVTAPSSHKGRPNMGTYFHAFKFDHEG
jgi:hypothetical protein